MIADTEVGEIYFGFLKKLNELKFDLTSKKGSEYSSLKSFNYINPMHVGMYDVDISMHVEITGVPVWYIKEAQGF